MDCLLRYLCLLCVFITPGRSLVCVKCVGDSPCTGPLETCQPNYSCGLAYRETTEGGRTYTDYILSCVPTSNCSKGGTISYSGGQMKLAISCCNTDNCRPSPPTWPEESSQLNGLQCPSCRSTTQTTCEPQETIQCTGTQQKCIVETTATTALREIAVGCGDSDFCDVSSYSYKSSAYIIYMMFACFKATTGSSSGVAAGTGPSCVVCSSDTSLTCSGPQRTPPANYRCASAYRIITENGQKKYGVIRSWVPVSKCDVSGTMTVYNSNFRILLGISCCTGDSCNPTIQDTTSTSTVLNQVQCPTCASDSSASCDRMTCTGSETQCVTYSVATSGYSTSTSSLQGCGTKSLCDAQSFSASTDSLTLEHRFACGSNTYRPGNGASGITTRSHGGLIFSLLCTAAILLVLHHDL